MISIPDLVEGIVMDLFNRIGKGRNSLYTGTYLIFFIELIGKGDIFGRNVNWNRFIGQKMIYLRTTAAGQQDDEN